MKGEVLCDLGVSVGPDKTEVACAGWTIPGGFDEGLLAKVLIVFIFLVLTHSGKECSSPKVCPHPPPFWAVLKAHIAAPLSNNSIPKTVWRLVY